MSIDKYQFTFKLVLKNVLDQKLNTSLSLFYALVHLKIKIASGSISL